MKNEKIQSFKELRVWQKGIEIVEDIYRMTKNFPKEEMYGLSSQMRKAAISIPSNIAEGFKRFHNKEYKQFLHITLGSSAEFETQLILSHKLDYVTNKTLLAITEKINQLSKMVTLLMRKLMSCPDIVDSF